MGGMGTKASVTNQRVAEDLGVTHSMISRIRSSDRFPGLDLLVRISTLLTWSLDDQAKAAQAGRYAEEFEKRLATHYDVE